MIETSNTIHQRAKDLFLRAIELPDSIRVETFLDQLGEDDPSLRTLVKRLLSAHHAADPILDAPDHVAASEAPSDPIKVGQRIGCYEIAELVGEGGMGLVYRADQRQPIRRTVALKIIKPGLDTREVLRRFRIEQQTLARLSHPHVARVLDSGQTDRGHPYFVMEFVEGRPLTRYCDHHRLSLETRLNLFLDVCGAVAFAHQKGVIHRDLKPRNVLVDVAGDSPSVKVIDFGLAKVIDGSVRDHSGATGAWQIVGTPGYMSPEQSDPNISDIDTRADVYGLGAMLYELLTGTTPIGRDTTQACSIPRASLNSANYKPSRPSVRLTMLPSDELSEVASRRSSEPRHYRQKVRGDLDWITLKAIEFERERRYASVTDFADDIRRFLTDQPIEARPSSSGYRLRMFLKRNRVAVIIAAVIMISILVTTAVGIQQARMTRTARDRAERLLAEVMQSQSLTRQLLYAADVTNAAVALRQHDLAEAEKMVERQRPGATADATLPDQRGIEWHFLRRQLDRSRVTHSICEDTLDAIAATADGRRVAIGGPDGIVRMPDPLTGKIIHELDGGHPDVSSLAISSRGDSLVVGTWGGIIQMWDLSDQPTVTELRADAESVRSVLFSPDGDRVLVSVDAPEVWILDASHGERLNRLAGHSRSIVNMALSADGRLLACASSDKTLSVWEWREGKLLHRTEPNKSRLRCVDFTPDGRYVVSATVSDDVQITSTESWVTSRLTKLPGIIQSIACSPQDKDSPRGTRVAIGCRTGEIHICSIDVVGLESDPLADGRTDKVFMTHQGRVNGITWLDQRRIASVGEDGRLAVTTIDEAPASLASDAFPSHGIAVSEQGRWIAGNDDHQVQLIDTLSGQSRLVTGLPADHPIFGMAFSPRGEQLLIAMAGGILVTEDVAHPERARTESLPIDAEFSILRFSSDGKRLMLHSRTSSQLAVVDYPSLQLRFQVGCPESFAADLSTDGRTVAFNYRRNVLLYDVDSGTPIGESQRHHRESINDLRFDPTGRWLASASDDNTIHIWNLQDGTPPELVGVHPEGAPKTLAISSDGRTLLAASLSGDVWCWNLPVRQKLFSLTRCDEGIRNSLLSRNDSVLVMLDSAGMIRWLRLGDHSPDLP